MTLFDRLILLSLEHHFYIYYILYIILVMLVMNTRKALISCELLPPIASDIDYVDYEHVPEHGLFKLEHGTQNGTCKPHTV
jgi:hypothetical protein